MPISGYIKDLRAFIGRKPLLTPGVDAVIYNDSGELLFIKRSDNGLWGLPGGQLDPLEPPALGLVREVFEETGLKVVPDQLLGIFGGNDAFHIRYSNGDEVHPVVSLFSCRIVGGELQNRDGEATEVRFFAPDELPTELTSITAYLLARSAQKSLFDWDERWLDALG